jgi:voltage-gated potassium channel
MKAAGPAADLGVVSRSGKPTVLSVLLTRLERPMLGLSFVWFLVIIAELVNGTTLLHRFLGTGLWALLIIHVSLRFANFPDRVVFLKRNWLFVLAMLVPALRFFPFLQALPLMRALTATFGLQVVWMFASADQGLRSLSRTMGRRGAGYALTFTAVVILSGAAGMLHFEAGIPDAQGIHSYPKALWWVCMQLTNIGSGYNPKTRGGEILCLGVSVYAAAMFGYLTALFATVFIGRKSQTVQKPAVDAPILARLESESNAIKKTLEEVLRRLPEPTLKNRKNE